MPVKTRSSRRARRDVAVFAKLALDYRRVPRQYKKIMDRFLAYIATKTNPKQAWFWTSSWLKKEIEADEDIKRNRIKSFRTMNDLIAGLDA